MYVTVIKHKTMDSPDLGPEGCWIFAGIMAIFGVIGCVIGIIKLVQWIITHVSIN